jgi:hypothetical protein
MKHREAEPVSLSDERGDCHPYDSCCFKVVEQVVRGRLCSWGKRLPVPVRLDFSRIPYVVSPSVAVEWRRKSGAVEHFGVVQRAECDASDACDASSVDGLDTGRDHLWVVLPSWVTPAGRPVSTGRPDGCDLYSWPQHFSRAVAGRGRRASTAQADFSVGPDSFPFLRC